MQGEGEGGAKVTSQSDQPPSMPPYAPGGGGVALVIGAQYTITKLVATYTPLEGWV